MKSFEFYISKYYFITKGEEVDISLEPMLRRRLSMLDKAVFQTLEHVFTPEVKGIVYSSQKGAYKRLDKIIEQYKLYNEVSPAQFSASVHNFSVGFFTQRKKLNIPYCAISSGESSLSGGLVKSMISNAFPVLFCYAQDGEKTESVGCAISKTETPGAIKCRMVGEGGINHNEFEDFVAFLKGQEKFFQGGLCRLERSGV